MKELFESGVRTHSLPTAMQEYVKKNVDLCEWMGPVDSVDTWFHWFRDGTKTTCVIMQVASNNNTVPRLKAGACKRNPVDEHDDNTALWLSLQRACKQEWK